MKDSKIDEILDKEGLLEILPFGKTKLNSLLMANLLPVTKIGKDYITTKGRIYEWIKQNEGKELYY